MRSQGSEGSRRSHCEAMKALLATPHPAALILEDDAAVAADTPSLLESVNWWPRGTSLLRLESSSGKRRLFGPCVGTTPSGRGLHKLYGWHGGAAGYVIDRRGAETVLAVCEMSRLSIDQIMFDLRKSRTARHLKPLQIAPAICRSNTLRGLPVLARRLRERRAWRHRLEILTLLATNRIQKHAIAYQETM